MVDCQRFLLESIRWLIIEIYGFKQMVNAIFLHIYDSQILKVILIAPKFYCNVIKNFKRV